MLEVSINFYRSKGTKCFEYLTEKAKCLIKICMINERGMVEGLLQFCVKGKYENVATGVLRVKVLREYSALCCVLLIIGVYRNTSLHNVKLTASSDQKHKWQSTERTKISRKSPRL